ncbi:MAG: CHAT domain-containing protein [Acidobacteriota bacterium]
MDLSIRKRHRLWALTLSVAVVVSSGSASADGLVITEAAAHGAGAIHGLATGHLLEAWERRSPTGQVVASGDFRHALDLWQVEVEEKPRGGVRLRVASLQGTEPASWWLELPAGEWRIEVESVDLGRFSEGCDPEAATDDPADARRPIARAEAAQRAMAAGFDDEAECFWRAAVTNGGALPATERAHVEARYARFLLQRDRYQDASAHHEAALRLRQSVDPSSLSVAASLDQLGIAVWYLGDRERVRTLWHEALAIREQQIPESLLVAKSLNNLSLVSPRETRLALLLRALAIRDRLDPAGTTTATLLTNLGKYFERNGDQEAAEAYLRRAETTLRRIAPDSRQLAVTRLALASVEQQRGRLGDAEATLRDAVSALERSAPQSFDLADAWLQLGDLLLTRFDSERAEVYLRRALELFERIAPDSPQVVPLLLNLGLAAKHRGHRELARQHYEAAIARGTGGDADGMRGINVAIAFNNLGTLAEGGGDLEAAARHYEQAREAFARVEPEGLDVARTLTNLGQLRLRRGDLQGAERLVREAHRMQGRLAPQSAEHARSLAALAQIELGRGNTATAEQRFRQALEALDADPVLAAGGDLARARASDDTSPIIHAFATFLIDQDRAAEAFTLVERARARSFRAMLAHRNLRLRQLTPDVESERRQLQAEYDRTLLELGLQASDAGAADQGPTAEDLRTELETLRERQLTLTAETARTTPRLGALTAPDSAEVGAIRAALPPGVVVLSYLVGSESSALFRVTADGVRALPIPFGAQDLEHDVDGLLASIARRETLDRPRYRRAAERLSTRLLSPAAESLASAEAVIVIPHGPLHRLPFAALIDPANPQRYWVEALPLTLAPSLVALAELEARPRPRRPLQMAAFGVADPRRRLDDRALGGTGRSDLDSTSLDNTGLDSTGLETVRGSVRAGLDLTPLPHVRREVESLSRLFGSRARVFLGSEATEEQAKDLDTSTRVVHFATHAWVDDRFPLESGLLLSIPQRIEPGRDNGVLQAWEVIEQIRLDADLVTLSGCRTGLGRAFSNEGILGLTRAFHVAGARAVLASLWQVSDASTGTLMMRFYHHMRQGLSVAESLRAAQLDLVRTAVSDDLDVGRPFHWAGFQLFGDGTSTWTTPP